MAEVTYPAGYLETRPQSSNWFEFVDVAASPSQYDEQILSDGIFRVSKISVGGERYVLRLPGEDEFLFEDDEDSDIGPSYDLRVRGLLKAQGVSQTEQLVAYSTDDLACITKYISADPLGKLSSMQVEQINANHFETALKSIAEMTERGVTGDWGSADNTLFSAKSGLHFVDYVAHKPVDYLPEPTAEREYCDFLRSCGESVYGKTEATIRSWRSALQIGRAVLLAEFPDALKTPRFSEHDPIQWVDEL